MIIVTGTIDLDESSIAPAKELAGAMANATRAEKGCLSYAFYQDIENPARFRIYEEWEDEAALQAHFKQPHMAKFNEGLSKLKVLGADVKKAETTGFKKL